MRDDDLAFLVGPLPTLSDPQINHEPDSPLLNGRQPR